MEVHGGPAKRKRRKRPDPEWLEFISDDEKEQLRIAHWKSVPLSEVGLPVRIANTLEAHGILTVGDLAKRSADDLANIPNMGVVTTRRCCRLLDELNLFHRLKPR
jgi:DNA-directed RNA polymerase alpha subunit